MFEREDSDSEAPEEFTSQQGLLQDEEIRRVLKENKARFNREGKERRRKWAQRKTLLVPKQGNSAEEVNEAETKEESQVTDGMLPSDIVQLLAAQEKKVYLSNSEEEKAEEKPRSRKKKPKSLGVETVILKDMSPPQCLQNSLEFLKKKKMQVSRSSAVLNNPNQALRLIATSGLLSKN